MQRPMERRTLRGDPEQDLRFELGGPAYHLMRRIGLMKPDDPSVLRRSVAFLAVG